MSARESCGIAVRIQQTLLRREQRARAVHVDRAAFEDHVVERKRGTPSASAISARDRIVEVVGRILAAPGVVVEMQRRQRLAIAAARVTKIAP